MGRTRQNLDAPPAFPSRARLLKRTASGTVFMGLFVLSQYSPFRIPRLTPLRIGFAFAVAVATDAIQLFTGPAGWLFIDEILDVIAMVITSIALGFHPLLLPTFIIKLIPVADWLPSWTGCTVAVVLLRRRAQSPSAPMPAQVVAPPLLPPPIPETIEPAPPKSPQAQ